MQMLLVLLHIVEFQHFHKGFFFYFIRRPSQTGHFLLCAPDKQPMNKNKTANNLYISVKHGAKMM